MQAIRQSPLAIMFDDELWGSLEHHEQTAILQHLEQRVKTYEAAGAKAAERKNQMALDNLRDN